MKTMLKKVIEPAVIVILFAAFVAVLVVQSTKKPAPAEQTIYEKRWFTAEDKLAYDELTRHLREHTRDYNAIDDLTKKQDELLNKFWLSKKDKQELNSIPYLLTSYYESVKPHYSRDWLYSEINSLGTTDPADGVEYVGCYEVKVMPEENDA